MRLPSTGSNTGNTSSKTTRRRRIPVLCPRRQAGPATPRTSMKGLSSKAGVRSRVRGTSSVLSCMGASLPNLSRANHQPHRQCNHLLDRRIKTGFHESTTGNQSPVLCRNKRALGSRTQCAVAVLARANRRPRGRTRAALPTSWLGRNRHIRCGRSFTNLPRSNEKSPSWW